MISKEKVGALIAIIFMTLYFIYPPNIFGILYEFDFESLAPVLLILVYYFYKENRWLLFILCALAVILVKENMPLVVIAFGIHGLFTKKNKLTWGIMPIVLGILSFYSLTKIFLPWITGTGAGETYSYISRNYAHLGGSIGGIIKTVFLNPAEILQTIFNPKNALWLNSVFGQFLYIPLFNLSVLFLISPIILQHLLSLGWQEHTIYFQYMTPVAPFVFLALAGSFAFFIKLRPKLKYFLLITITLFSLLDLSLHKPMILTRYFSAKAALNAHTADYSWKMIRLIPPDAPVIATFAFLAELSTRKQLFALHKIYTSIYQPYYLPADVKYALLDLNDIWLEYAFLKDFDLTSEKISAFFEQGNWSVKSAAENIVLLERNSANTIKLLEHSPDSFSFIPTHTEINVDPALKLLSLNAGPRLDDDSGILPLIFYWQAQEDISSEYFMTIKIENNHEILAQRIKNIGSPQYPVQRWQAGEYIKENYWLVLPQGLSDADPTIEIEFYKVATIPDDNQDTQAASDSFEEIKLGILRLKFSELK